MLGVMINRLSGFQHSRSAERPLTRIQIPIEAREIAAGNVDADAMRGFEDIARRPQINRVFVNPARLNRLGVFRRVTKARRRQAYTIPLSLNSRVVSRIVGRSLQHR